MIPLFDHHPSRTAPLVTRALLYVNALGFLVQWWLERRGVTWIAAGYGWVPSRISADPVGEWYKALTALFLHADFAHLGWNLLFLHIFGDNVEARLGKARYLVFYLVSGVVAALAQFAIDPHSSVPMIGASGAIAGVLGAYLVLYPRSPIAVVNPILPLWLFLGPLFSLPAWLVVGLWFIGNVFGGLASLSAVSSGGGVAFFAHLGGFIAGLLLVKPLLYGRAVATAERAGPSHAAPAPERRVFWKSDGRPFWK